MMMVAMMVPRFGRSFGGGPTDQESCGEKSESRTRPGYVSRRQVVQCLH
jgi:hypothetical protein